MIRGPSWRAVLGLALILLLAPIASAQPRRTPLAETTPRVTFAAALSLGLAVALSLGDPVPAPRWAGNPFDDAVRDGLRLPELGARRAIATSSDVLLAAVVAFEVIAEGLVAPLVQGDPDLAWQATAAYGLVLGITLSLDELVKVAVARQRPTDPGCDVTPMPVTCTPHSRGMSFYSGHAATSFASAGFSCAMHLERTLYGDALADGATCGGTLAAAALVGLFRVMGDQHHLTDVLVGAAIGFATGYLVPLFVVPQRSAPGPSLVVVPSAGVEATGLSSLGVRALGSF